MCFSPFNFTNTSALGEPELLAWVCALLARSEKMRHAAQQVVTSRNCSPVLSHSLVLMHLGVGSLSVGQQSLPVML